MLRETQKVEKEEDEVTRRFLASWEDDRTAEEIIEDIYGSRRSLHHGSQLLPLPCDKPHGSVRMAGR